MYKTKSWERLYRKAKMECFIVYYAETAPVTGKLKCSKQASEATDNFLLTCPDAAWLGDHDSFLIMAASDEAAVLGVA